MNKSAIITLPPEDPVIITPSYLKMTRMLLGLSQGEAAKLLDLRNQEEVRNLERGRTFFIYQGHADLLTKMLTRVNQLLEDSLQGEAPEFLFCYPNFEVLEIYEPRLAWMRLVSVHQMFIARLFDEWQQAGHSPTIVELVPSQYQQFLLGKADAPEHRNAWAQEHVKSFGVRNGLPSELGRNVRLQTRGES